MVISLEDLVDDVLIHILSMLTLGDVLSVRQVKISPEAPLPSMLIGFPRHQGDSNQSPISVRYGMTNSISRSSPKAFRYRGIPCLSQRYLLWIWNGALGSPFGCRGCGPTQLDPSGQSSIEMFLRQTRLPYESEGMSYSLSTPIGSSLGISMEPMDLVQRT